jgi:hypothetical protein
LTINKANFQQVIAQLNSTWASVIVLDNDMEAADPENTFGVALSSIFGNLSSIEAWANAAIEQANQEEQQAVMNNFLMELKVVFDKYTASIEIGSDATGYGESYGEGETAVGIKLTAVLAGVTATKEINKSVIVSGDLV